MTIGRKLILSFAAMLAVLLLLGGESVNAISGLNERFHVTADQTFHKVVLAARIDTAKSNMLAGQRGMIMFTTSKETDRANAARDLFLKSADSIKAALDEVEPLLVLAETKTVTGRLRNDLAQWVAVYPEMDALCRAGDAARAATLAGDRTLPIYKDMNEDTARLTSLTEKVLEDDRQAAAGQNARSRWVTTAMIAVAVVIGAGIIVLIRRLNATLVQTAREMAETAEQVAASSGQLASTSQDLAKGASDQAASLEETSASTEEINSLAGKNADASEETVAMVAASNRDFENANEKLGHMLAAMQDISGSSDKISKIIKVIDEIAFQTNILALNAAVEAARAGEAGMGFAVVADEVRNLAQRCAQAARDTDGLIHESIERAADGSAKVREVADAVSALTASAAKMKSLVESVQVSSTEQAKGIQQVAVAVARMEQVTQQQAASAEESASAAEELSAQSDGMRGIVRRLQSMVGAV